MSDHLQEDNHTRAARRALFMEGLPVVTLGALALALGSGPDPGTTLRNGWLAATTVFTLSVVWLLVRAFRRADEYLRRIQLESMAVAFAAVMVALWLATALAAADVVDLRQVVPAILVAGPALWLVLADLRTRWHR